LARKMLVYDPPIAGLPYLVVVLEDGPPARVRVAEACATAELAHAALLDLADRLEKAAAADPGCG
jgi:hypothetical protein